jgi:hypothetical protein
MNLAVLSRNNTRHVSEAFSYLTDVVELLGSKIELSVEYTRSVIRLPMPQQMNRTIKAVVNVQ